jgi:hypothetical protein
MPTRLTKAGQPSAHTSPVVREAADDRGSTIAARRVDQRRPQHDPIEIEHAKMIVGRFLAERVFVARRRIGADGRDLHDAPHAR